MHFPAPSGVGGPCQRLVRQRPIRKQRSSESGRTRASGRRIATYASPACGKTRTASRPPEPLHPPPHKATHSGALERLSRRSAADHLLGRGELQRQRPGTAPTSNGSFRGHSSHPMALQAAALGRPSILCLHTPSAGTIPYEPLTLWGRGSPSRQPRDLKDSSLRRPRRVKERSPTPHCRVAGHWERDARMERSEGCWSSPGSCSCRCRY
jgi:hypothetical protein